MLDPVQLANAIGEVIDPSKRARLPGFSMPQRNALVTLLGGPAHQLGHMGWLNDAGMRFMIDRSTMRSLVVRGLVSIGKTKRLAQLTERGRWYGLSAAADEADRLTFATKVW